MREADREHDEHGDQQQRERREVGLDAEHLPLDGQRHSSRVTVERRLWTSPVIVVPVPRVTEPSTTTSVWAVARGQRRGPAGDHDRVRRPADGCPSPLTSTIAPTCCPGGTSTAPSTAMIAPRSAWCGSGREGRRDQDEEEDRDRGRDRDAGVAPKVPFPWAGLSVDVDRRPGDGPPPAGQRASLG